MDLLGGEKIWILTGGGSIFGKSNLNCRIFSKGGNNLNLKFVFHTSNWPNQLEIFELWSIRFSNLNLDKKLSFFVEEVWK